MDTDAATGARAALRLPVLNRRKFLNAFCASGGAALLGSGSSEAQPVGLRIWDAHSHLHGAPGDTPEQRMEFLIRCADRVGVERLILSQGYSADLHPTPDQLRQENDRVLRAVRRFPDRAYGSVYLSPSYVDFQSERVRSLCPGWSDDRRRGAGDRQAMQRSRARSHRRARRLNEGAHSAALLAQNRRQ